MGGLVLSLKPDEKFIVNGAVLKNGPKRSQICIESDSAHILRMRDALHPSDVNTPVKRVYYVAQLIMAGELDVQSGIPSLTQGLGQLYDAFTDRTSRDILEKAIQASGKKQFYTVLLCLKKLFDLEEKLLNYTAPQNQLSTPLQKAV